MRPRPAPLLLLGLLAACHAHSTGQVFALDATVAETRATLPYLAREARRAGLRVSPAAQRVELTLADGTEVAFSVLADAPVCSVATPSLEPAEAAAAFEAARAKAQELWGQAVQARAAERPDGGAPAR